MRSSIPSAPVVKNAVAKRQAAERRGRQAESLVADHWRSRGFSVLAERMRTKLGEIDLVVADPSTLIFLEVKSRKSRAEAAHAVSPRQQTRLYQAAGCVLADHAAWHRPEIRFDVALVCRDAVDFVHDAIRQY